MRKRKTRPDAILIKPTEGRSYAEILGEIRKRVKPDATETEIRSIRKARNGGVLLELGASSKGKEAFCKEIQGILDGQAVVTDLQSRRTFTISDLDCLADEKEVEAALRRDLSDLGEVRVALTPENLRKQRVAIVQMGEKSANKLLERGRIKIGWVSCRVRARAEVTRCYRCFGYGHTAAACKGTDRGGLCFKCGQAGHAGKVCPNVANCALCAEKKLGQKEVAHVPGTGQYAAFREALAAAKRRLR